MGGARVKGFFFLLGGAIVVFIFAFFPKNTKAKSFFFFYHAFPHLLIGAKVNHWRGLFKKSPVVGPEQYL